MHTPQTLVISLALYSLNHLRPPQTVSEFESFRRLMKSSLPGTVLSEIIGSKVEGSGSIKEHAIRIERQEIVKLKFGTRGHLTKNFPRLETLLKRQSDKR